MIAQFCKIPDQYKIKHFVVFQLCIQTVDDTWTLWIWSQWYILDDAFLIIKMIKTSGICSFIGIIFAKPGDSSVTSFAFVSIYRSQQYDTKASFLCSYSNKFKLNYLKREIDELWLHDTKLYIHWNCRLFRKKIDSF